LKTKYPDKIFLIDINKQTVTFFNGDIGSKSFWNYINKLAANYLSKFDIIYFDFEVPKHVNKIIYDSVKRVLNRDYDYVDKDFIFNDELFKIETRINYFDSLSEQYKTLIKSVGSCYFSNELNNKLYVKAYVTPIYEIEPLFNGFKAYFQKYKPELKLDFDEENFIIERLKYVEDSFEHQFDCDKEIIEKIANHIVENKKHYINLVDFELPEMDKFRIKALLKSFFDGHYPTLNFVYTEECRIMYTGFKQTECLLLSEDKIKSKLTSEVGDIFINTLMTNKNKYFECYDCIDFAENPKPTVKAHDLYDVVCEKIKNFLDKDKFLLKPEDLKIGYFDENPEAFRKQPVKDKMILWWIRYYGSYLPEFFRYPLYYCMQCMASIWSVPFWAAYSKYLGLNLVEASLLWMMYAGALILVNYLLKKVADL